METGNLMIDAQSAFTRERRRRRREQLLGRLLPRTRRPHGLQRLDEALGMLPPPSLAPSGGRREIPLETIVGTAEKAKAEAFDGRFRPPSRSRSRWERLWMAGRRGAPLPPISVFRVGDCHFVSDGHHRVSVARALGMVAIDAEVVDLRRASGLG